MSETALERSASFFCTPERCRQQYLEAWHIGKAVYDEMLRVRGELVRTKRKLRNARLRAMTYRVDAIAVAGEQAWGRCYKAAVRTEKHWRRKLESVKRGA